MSKKKIKKITKDQAVQEIDKLKKIFLISDFKN